MKISGPIEHQKHLPAELLAVLRQILTSLQYEHNDIVLHIEGALFIAPQLAGIKPGKSTDDKFHLTLQGKDAQKRYSCYLTSVRNGDTGHVLKHKIIPLLNEQAAAPVASTDPSMLLRVFNLAKADEDRFPRKALRKLSDAVIELDVFEDVVLRVDIVVRSDADMNGVRLDEDEIHDHSIKLSLQDFHPSMRVRCVLRINGNRTGQWLYDALAAQLAQNVPAAPPAQPPARAALKGEILSPLPSQNPAQDVLSIISSRETEEASDFTYLGLLTRTKAALAFAQKIEVPYDQIRPYPDQPRVFFDPESLKRLSESINAGGQTTPGLIRHKPGSTPYELIDGERRWRGIGMIPAETRPLYKAQLIEADDDVVQFLIAGMANFNREGHTSTEVTETIVRLHERMKIPIKEVAILLGISELWARDMYGLRKLTPQVLGMLSPSVAREKRLPLTAAIQISKLDSPAHQLELAQRVISKDVPLAQLRTEVVNTGTRAGIQVRVREVPAWEQWRNIVRRTALLSRSAAELKASMSKPEIAGHLRMNRGDGTAQIEQLKQITAVLDECQALIHEARGIKLIKQ